jgi:hypothetical protein
MLLISQGASFGSAITKGSKSYAKIVQWGVAEIPTTLELITRSTAGKQTLKCTINTAPNSAKKIIKLNFHR